MIKLLKKIWQPLPVAILSFSISLTAGAIGLQASATAAHEAKNRASAVQAISQAQDQKMRELLCGYFEPASVLTTLTPEQKTRITKTIKLLDCTPDVTDGK